MLNSWMEVLRGLLKVEYADQYPWATFFLSWAAWHICMLAIAIPLTLFEEYNGDGVKGLKQRATTCCMSTSGFPLLALGFIVLISFSGFIYDGDSFSLDMAHLAEAADFLVGILFPPILLILMVVPYVVRMTKRLISHDN